MGSNDQPSTPLIGRVLDRFWESVDPRRAFERHEARAAMRFFGYDNATPGTLRGNSGGQAKNAAAESPKMQTDAVKIMWDARDVSRNNSFMGGLLRKTVRYCFQKLSYHSRTGDQGVDKIYEDYFHDWCGRADITGRHRLKKLTRMALFCMLRDGDFGFMKVRVPYGNISEIRLQCIEADRIGNPLDPAGGSYREDYIRGITIDDVGTPISYRIYKRHRIGLQYTFDQEVDPSRFIHIMDPDESDKYRPVSWLQPVLGDARDLNEIWAFAKQRAKFNSQFSGFFKPVDPFNKQGFNHWDNAEDKTNGIPASMNAVAGRVMQIPAGAGDVVFPPAMNEPGNAFMNLWETGIRKVASALELPYGVVWDMAVFGGVTARLEAMSADRVFGDKRETMVDRFLDEIKNDVLANAIAYGEIPPHPNYKSGKFLFGARITADVGHETTALVQAVDAGFTSKTRVIEEWYDEDFDELTDTQAAETLYRQQVAGTTGVPIELLDKSQPNATSMLAAINSPPVPPPQPPPGLVGEQGDKGVKPLLDILKEVGQGAMDRESAINTLMQLYDLSHEEADLMVPEAPKNQALEQRQGNGDGNSDEGNRPRFGLSRRKVAK